MLSQKELGNSRVVVTALATTLVFFMLMVVFVGEGFVRQVPIFWKEDIRATIAFKEIDGQLKVVGLIGNGGTDPILVMKSGNTPYILTVINQDTKPHMFYVYGLNAHTKALKAGENDTITLISKNEATYNYYDRFNPEKIIGQIISARVEATD